MFSLKRRAQQSFVLCWMPFATRREPPRVSQRPRAGSSKVAAGHASRSVCSPPSPPQTGDTVDRAVVCVPSDFGREAIYATLEAAQLAGVRRAVPLQEPVAAAIAHGLLANAGAPHPAPATVAA